MTPDKAPVRWRRSSYSGGNGGECVELSNTRDMVRDSKNPSGPVLAVDLLSFLATVKADGLSPVLRDA